MTRRQLETKAKTEQMSALFGIDPKWAVAVAMTESSLGERQVSPTGCSGVFNMSTIAIKDVFRLGGVVLPVPVEDVVCRSVLKMMRAMDHDLGDIFLGVAYLWLLLRRWGSIEAATEHFCDPKDRYFYLSRVKGYMDALSS